VTERLSHYVSEQLNSDGTEAVSARPKQ